MQVFFLLFIAEEHTIVGQADLAGLRVGATTHEGYGGDGVVGTAEGAHGHERGILAEATRHGVYLGGLQALMERERRQDRGQALGHHGLTGTGRTDEDDIM